MYEWWIYLLFGGLFFLRYSIVAGGMLSLAGLYCVSRLGLRSEAGHIWVIWALGGLLAYLHPRAMRLAIRPWTLVILATVLILGAGWILATSLNAYDLMAGVLLSFALFTLTVWSSALSAGWLLTVAPWVKRLAAFSFTLFLTHYTVLVHTRAFVDGWIGLVFSFLTANLVALAIASLTEFKLSALKRWLMNKARHSRTEAGTPA
jgi:hypothetical protein